MEPLIDAKIHELSSFPFKTFMLDLVTFYRIILESESLYSVEQ